MKRWIITLVVPLLFFAQSCSVGSAAAEVVRNNSTLLTGPIYLLTSSFIKSSPDPGYRAEVMATLARGAINRLTEDESVTLNSLTQVVYIFLDEQGYSEQEKVIISAFIYDLNAFLTNLIENENILSHTDRVSLAHVFRSIETMAKIYVG